MDETETGQKTKGFGLLARSEGLKNDYLPHSPFDPVGPSGSTTQEVHLNLRKEDGRSAVSPASCN
jgi:hypothetical protein